MVQGGLADQHRLEMEREAENAARGPGERYFQLLAEMRGRRFVELTKDSQFSEAWIVLAVLLALVGMAVNNSFVSSAGLAMLVIAATGWMWNELSLFGLHYRRRLSETRAFVGETVGLTVEVSNRKFLPVAWLQIVDVFPVSLPLSEVEVSLNRATNLGELTTFWSVGAFGRLTRHFSVRCAQRGYHSYGPARINAGDAFGMFSRRGTLPHRDLLIVYPYLYTVAELGLPAKNPFGERRSHEQLFEDPLRTAGVRDWQPADGLKRVHWKATARQQSTSAGAPAMLSRLYEPSEEPQVLIFLNVATLPKHWQGIIPELLERAVSVAGSLAVWCADLRLPVGLVANGYLPNSDQPIRLLPGRNSEQVMHIMELLAAVTAFAVQPIEEMVLMEAPRLPWGATLVVVTAVAHDALLASLLDLAQAGRRIVLFTLAEKPPQQYCPGIIVYHLPHLVEDLIAPVLMQAARPLPNSGASEAQ